MNAPAYVYRAYSMRSITLVCGVRVAGIDEAQNVAIAKRWRLAVMVPVGDGKPVYFCPILKPKT